MKTPKEIIVIIREGETAPSRMRHRGTLVLQALEHRDFKSGLAQTTKRVTTARVEKCVRPDERPNDGLHVGDHIHIIERVR